MNGVLVLVWAAEILSSSTSSRAPSSHQHWPLGDRPSWQNWLSAGQPTSHNKWMSCHCSPHNLLFWIFCQSTQTQPDWLLASTLIRASCFVLFRTFSNFVVCFRVPGFVNLIGSDVTWVSQFASSTSANISMGKYHCDGWGSQFKRNVSLFNFSENLYLLLFYQLSTFIVHCGLLKLISFINNLY